MALLGTARVPSLPPAPHEVLEDVWISLAEADPARAVLQAAALDGVARRAGQLPITGVALPAPAGEEAACHLPPAAVSALQRMLRGEFVQALPEWLEEARRGGFVAPARALPSLLARGTNQPPLRPAVRAVAGVRGCWLAQQREGWRWVAEEAKVPDDAWQLGDHTERLAWLRQMRATDPARAAEAIAADWAQASADHRESFTELAATAPCHPEDIPWLEGLALKERRQSTRRAAARALVQFPSSAFRQRVLDRAAHLLKMEGRLRRQLTLHPPDEFDSRWANDGLRENPPPGAGKRAWWAQQALAQVPLDAWSGVLGLPAGQLLRHRRDPDWEDTILRGWLESLQTQPVLVPDLLPFLVSLGDAYRAEVHLALKAVLESLPAAEAAELLEPLRLPENEMLDLLARHQPPVDPANSPTLARVLTRWSGSPSTGPAARPQAEALAMCPTPSWIPSLLKHLAALPELGAAAEQFARVLEFRQSYLAPLGD